MTGESAQQQGVERFLDARAPGPDVGGDDPLDQVVRALEPSPLADREPSGRPQCLGHTPGELEVPPAGAAPALQVERTQRAFVLDAFQDGIRDSRVLVKHIAPPGMGPVALAPPPEAGVKRERHPARFVAPVLEQRRSRNEQRLAECGVEPAKPGSEHDGVGAGSAHRHGVELQVAEVLDNPMAAFPRLRRPGAGLVGEAVATRDEQTGRGEGKPPHPGDVERFAVWRHAREVTFLAAATARWRIGARNPASHAHAAHRLQRTVTPAHSESGRR